MTKQALLSSVASLSLLTNVFLANDFVSAMDNSGDFKGVGAGAGTVRVRAEEKKEKDGDESKKGAKLKEEQLSKEDVLGKVQGLLKEMMALDHIMMGIGPEEADPLHGRKDSVKARILH